MNFTVKLSEDELGDIYYLIGYLTAETQNEVDSPKGLRLGLLVLNKIVKEKKGE